MAAETLLKDLLKAEGKWRASSPEWQKIMQQWETWKSQAKVRKAQVEKLREQSRKEEEELRRASESTWEESFDPQDPTPQFSFIGKRCAKSLLEDAINDLRWIASTTPSWVFQALRRGIGIHHSGMNKHYRTTVERRVLHPSEDALDNLIGLLVCIG